MLSDSLSCSSFGQNIGPAPDSFFVQEDMFDSKLRKPDLAENVGMVDSEELIKKRHSQMFHVHRLIQSCTQHFRALRTGATTSSMILGNKNGLFVVPCCTSKHQ